MDKRMICACVGQNKRWKMWYRQKNLTYLGLTGSWSSNRIFDRSINGWEISDSMFGQTRCTRLYLKLLSFVVNNNNCKYDGFILINDDLFKSSFKFMTKQGGRGGDHGWNFSTAHTNIKPPAKSKIIWGSIWKRSGRSNKCSQCGFVFLQAGNSRMHLKTQSGEKYHKRR